MSQVVKSCQNQDLTIAMTNRRAGLAQDLVWTVSDRPPVGKGDDRRAGGTDDGYAIGTMFQSVIAKPEQ